VDMLNPYEETEVEIDYSQDEEWKREWELYLDMLSYRYQQEDK
jgi:hypothetical protein